MINENIQLLSKKLLDKKEIKNIQQIIIDIKSKNKINVLKDLTKVLGIKPKRPLYYVAHEIMGLPKYGTRNTIRYAGDYIDQLVRFTLEDKRFLSQWFQHPLGPNINKLKKYIDLDLYESLSIFNKIYVQAKHEFNHHEDVSLFNYKEAVYMVYITKALSQKILPLSETARDYNNQGETAYHYNIID